MCCTLPLMIVGLINWLKHQDSSNTVIVKDITKKELAIVLLSQVVLFSGYYYLLKTFNDEGKYVRENDTPLYFGPKGSWHFVADNIYELRQLTRREYGEIPYIMLGFSLGSYLIRDYLIRYNETIDAGIIPAIIIIDKKADKTFFMPILLCIHCPVNDTSFYHSGKINNICDFWQMQVEISSVQLPILQ